MQSLVTYPADSPDQQLAKVIGRSLCLLGDRGTHVSPAGAVFRTDANSAVFGAKLHDDVEARHLDGYGSHGRDLIRKL